MKRREFLSLGTRAVAGLSVMSLASNRTRAALPQSQDVIVIGGGLAGLTAAYELHRQGTDVLLLEADSRPGGRVRTLRASFADGMYAEAGGQTMFPIVEDYAERYLNEFGLERAQPGPGGLGQVFVIRGQRIERPGRDDVAWPLNLSDREQSLGLAGMRREYLGSLTEALSGETSDWDWDRLAELDALSFDDWLRARGASSDAIELVNLDRTDFTALPAGRHSALSVAVGQESFRRLVGRPYSIDGGNDQLAYALANELRESVRYGARVTHVATDEEGVRVVYQRTGARYEARASRVICAVPPWALRRIDFDPPLSSEKQTVLAAAPVTNTCRFFIQTATRPWRDEGLSGSATTDGQVAYFWESSPWLDGPRGILHGWIGEESSAEFERLAPAERAALAVREAESVFPGISEHVEGVDSWCWGIDPVVPGHTLLFPPGTFVPAVLALERPEGRIHFAGTETAPPLVKGFLLGAIASGQRVAAELLAARRGNAL